MIFIFVHPHLHGPRATIHGSRSALCLPYYKNTNWRNPPRLKPPLREASFGDVGLCRKIGNNERNRHGPWWFPFCLRLYSTPSPIYCQAVYFEKITMIYNRCDCPGRNPAGPSTHMKLHAGRYLSFLSKKPQRPQDPMSWSYRRFFRLPWIISFSSTTQAGRWTRKYRHWSRSSSSDRSGASRNWLMSWRPLNAFHWTSLRAKEILISLRFHLLSYLISIHMENCNGSIAGKSREEILRI